MAMEDSRTSMILQELVRRTNEETRRLRDLEQNVLTLQEKTNSLENLVLSNTKKSNDKFSSIEARINILESELAKIANSLEKINKQINRFARKTDIRELERMFDLLSPVKQEFVTRDELEERVKE